MIKINFNHILFFFIFFVGFFLDYLNAEIRLIWDSKLRFVCSIWDPDGYWFKLTVLNYRLGIASRITALRKSKGEEAIP